MEAVNDSQFEQDKKINLQDFSRGFIDATKLYLNNPDTRNGTGITAVAGFTAIFPEKFNYQTLNQSPEFHQLCAVVYIATLINDYIDMQSYLGTSDGQELKTKIESKWQKSLEGIDFGGKLSQDKKDIIQSYMASITLLDDYERSHPDKTSSGTIKAKELENAVSIVHCGALVLGSEGIEKDCLRTFEDISADQIKSKYAWLLDRKPENEIQRRFCAFLDVTMLIQTVDDKYDFEIDDTLKIRNIYSALMTECQGNREIADAKLNEIQKQYQVDAHKYGVSSFAFLGNKAVIDLTKSLQYKYPQKYGGYRERLLK